MKNKHRILIILLIVIAIFSTCYFVIPYPHNGLGVYISTYIFTLIAILGQLYPLYLAFYKSKNLASRVYGLPIVKVGVIYLVLQVIAMLALTITNAFVPVPVWIAILVQVIILGFGIIGVFVKESYAETVTALDSEQKANTRFLDDLKSNAKSLARRFNYEPLKRQFNDLVDLILYSDPVSNADLEDIETRITDKFDELSTNYKANNYVDVANNINELNDLMEERNSLVKRYK